MAVPAMKQYEFTDFAVWADTVNESIVDFTEQFGFHPNIMCASVRVWRAINHAVQNDLDNVVNDEGEHPGPDDVVELAGFQGEGCHLTFTVNEVPPYPAFLLVFDEDPTFDGEPEPISEDEETIVAAVPYRL